MDCADRQIAKAHHSEAGGSALKGRRRSIWSYTYADVSSSKSEVGELLIERGKRQWHKSWQEHTATWTNIR